ncbi:hypothetical protein GQ85_03495 [Rhodococcus rhodochrous]|nr:hypothetical protein GQ85_03495 [Rhodococcus rhodochrous]
MTDTERTRASVLQFNQARERNDTDAVAALLTEDVEWHPPQSIRPRPFRGRDRVAKALTGGTTGNILQAGSIEREVVMVVADGDTAIVRQLMRATRVDGEAYSNDYCWVYTFLDGLIIRMDEYGDTLLIARAGFVPLLPANDSPSASGANGTLAAASTTEQI